MQATRPLTHWDDEDDIRLDLEDDEPRTLPPTATWLPLLAAYLLALAAFTPTVRLACWAILWVAHLAGTEPAPPPAYTPWAPHLYP